MDTADFRNPLCRHMKLCRFLETVIVDTRLVTIKRRSR